MQIQIPAVITGWVFLSPASIQHLEVNFNAAIKILKKKKTIVRDHLHPIYCDESCGFQK